MPPFSAAKHFLLKGTAPLPQRCPAVGCGKAWFKIMSTVLVSQHPPPQRRLREAKLLPVASVFKHPLYVE